MLLSFVDKVFLQPQVFGDQFLSLAPKGAVNNPGRCRCSTRALVFPWPFLTARIGGPGLGAGRLECARRIAEHFASLRDDASHPASPSDMVLLLGNMSNVGVYAQALRDAGFECLVAGGSTFSNSQEVTLVASVVRLFSSCTDNEALYTVLTSPLVRFGRMTPCFTWLQEPAVRAVGFAELWLTDLLPGRTKRGLRPRPRARGPNRFCPHLP